MTNPYTMPTASDLPQPVSTDTATGPWSVGPISEAQTPRKSPRAYLPPLGVGLLLALTTLTSVADPWAVEHRRQTQPTAYVLIKSTEGRRMSLREARQMALQLMADMEAARLQAAEDEARRAFDLEDIA